MIMLASGMNLVPASVEDFRLLAEKRLPWRFAASRVLPIC